MPFCLSIIKPCADSSSSTCKEERIICKIAIGSNVGRSKALVPKTNDLCIYANLEEGMPQRIGCSKREASCNRCCFHCHLRSLSVYKICFRKTSSKQQAIEYSITDRQCPSCHFVQVFLLLTRVSILKNECVIIASETAPLLANRSWWRC